MSSRKVDDIRRQSGRPDTYPVAQLICFVAAKQDVLRLEIGMHQAKTMYIYIVISLSLALAQ